MEGLVGSEFTKSATLDAADFYARWTAKRYWPSDSVQLHTGCHLFTLEDPIVL